MAYNYHIMTYTPLEREDGTALSVRVKTHLCHAQEDPTEECAESLNKPPTDGGAFRRHRDQRPAATTTGTLSRQSGLVEVCVCSSTLVQGKLFGNFTFCFCGNH
jgi:hypothetical protein